MRGLQQCNGPQRLVRSLNRVLGIRMRVRSLNRINAGRRKESEVQRQFARSLCCVKQRSLVLARGCLLSNSCSRTRDKRGSMNTFLCAVSDVRTKHRCKPSRAKRVAQDTDTSRIW